MVGVTHQKKLRRRGLPLALAVLQPLGQGHRLGGGIKPLLQNQERRPLGMEKGRLALPGPLRSCGLASGGAGDQQDRLTGEGLALQGCIEAVVAIEHHQPGGSSCRPETRTQPGPSQPQQSECHH